MRGSTESVKLLSLTVIQLRKKIKKYAYHNIITSSQSNKSYTKKEKTTWLKIQKCKYRQSENILNLFSSGDHVKTSNRIKLVQTSYVENPYVTRFFNPLWYTLHANCTRRKKSINNHFDSHNFNNIALIKKIIDE